MTLAERIEKFNNLMGDIVPPEVKSLNSVSVAISKVTVSG